MHSRFSQAFVICALLLASCASYDPQPYESVGFLDRAVTKSKDGVTTSVVALGPEEAQAAFGVSMLKNSMQPVWLRIANGTKEDLTLLPLFTDPLYFTPAEAAFVNHHWTSSEQNAAMDKLSDAHRTVLVLHEFERMEYKKIAEAVGCSIGTVMSRLFYARRRLAALLADLREES